MKMTTTKTKTQGKTIAKTITKTFREESSTKDQTCSRFEKLASVLNWNAPYPMLAELSNYQYLFMLMCQMWNIPVQKDNVIAFCPSDLNCLDYFEVPHGTKQAIKTKRQRQYQSERQCQRQRHLENTLKRRSCDHFRRGFKYLSHRIFPLGG